jgi:hypothetical protein
MMMYHTNNSVKPVFFRERIVYDSSLILGFTTGRILLVGDRRLSGCEPRSSSSVVICEFLLLLNFGKEKVEFL